MKRNHHKAAPKENRVIQDKQAQNQANEFINDLKNNNRQKKHPNGSASNWQKNQNK